MDKTTGRTPTLPEAGSVRARDGRSNASAAPGPPAGLSCECTVLGMPVSFICEALAVGEGVRAACASWSGTADPSSRKMSIHVTVRDRVGGREQPRMEVRNRRLTLRADGVEGGADANERRGWCLITPEYLAAPRELLSLVLEPLVLFLATHNGRTPIHASAVRVDDLAILFAGPSGAGKSSLALAADRAGWTVLSEDTVYLQLEPRFQVWGWHGPVHLLPAKDSPQFERIRVRNGRVKWAVPLSSSDKTSEPTTKAVLCLLQHGKGARLTRLSPPSAERRLGPLEPGFDLLEPEINAAHRHLLRNGAWLLSLSRKPDEAIAMLAANMSELILSSRAVSSGACHHVAAA